MKRERASAGQLRRARVAAVAITCFAALVASATSAVAAVPRALSTAPGSSAVTYRGWTSRTPAGWPVIDLAAHPSACVRFDVHAVYLGRPGAQQSCPSHLSGRTEALLVEPAEDPTPTPDLTSGTVAIRPLSPLVSAAQQVRVSLPTAGVIVTATWGTDRAIVEHTLTTAVATSGWRAPLLKQRIADSAQLQSSAAVQPSTSVGTSGPFVGEAFDACTAPSLATMTAWLSSPYRAVGVYIGGVNRACGQPNLTTNWVSTVTGQGWRLVPIYVGRQAPYPSCGCQPIIPSQAAAQGRFAAEDAVTNARSVGIGAGAALFNDMEAYTRGSTNSSAVLTFLSSWTIRLHELGYRSGVYSGPGSGIRDLTAITPSDRSGLIAPDVVWYARWDGRDQTVGEPSLPPDRWTHQRLHQYASGASTWGGVRIDIDRSAIDATLTGQVSTPPPRPTPPSKSDLLRAYVGRTYRLFLGRSPSSSETDKVTWNLASGKSRTSFLLGVLASHEWAARQTLIQYLTILGRAPDASGAVHWIAWLHGAGHPAVLAAYLASSAERWHRSGANAASYVRGLYQDILGRPADPVMTVAWAKRLASGMSRLQVALAFTTGQDHVAHFITTAFQGLLGRLPDSGGRAYWSHAYEMHFDPGAVLVPIGASPEAL